jgi:hypothetical protein
MRNSVKYWAGYLTVTNTVFVLAVMLFSPCNCARIVNAEDKNSTRCGRYKIDTAAILANRNLDQLISKIDSSKLTTYSNYKSLPRPMRVLLDDLVGTKFKIADPGEEWQATDYIVKKGLPDRQFVYLGVGQDIILFAYNLGGIGTSERILIIEFRDSCIKDFWCGGALKDLTDKSQIISHLKANKNEHWGLNTNIIYF